ncbi:MAG: hypothetical protein ACP5VE_08805 [Chthonomonadales bacterium]
MEADPYLPEDPEYTLVDSARASVCFAHRCLEPHRGVWRAVSSFVDVEGRPQYWHDFGSLEGPGWAANAVGGALLLYRWAAFDHSPVLEHVALGLLDHVLEDGFLDGSGLILGYRDTRTDRICLNFKHTNEWFCPGSGARVALQMLDMAELLPPSDVRPGRLIEAAVRYAEWVLRHVELVDGWYPRRCTPEGAHYRQGAEGGQDPVFGASGDGLYLIWLFLELAQRGLADTAAEARKGLDTFIQRGGIYGSINHDTYDADENVSRAEAFRVLRRAARFFGDPAMEEFAYVNALAGLERFLLRDNRNGVETMGLFYMEDTWDTAYFWENAEIALAYLEAYEGTKRLNYCRRACTVLRAMAKHHYGPHGFLTEGVDWNNHVGREHHIGGAEYGAIRYTEPLLNNLHHVEPILRCLELGMM